MNNPQKKLTPVKVKGWVLHNPNTKKIEFMTVDMRPYGYIELGQIDTFIDVELRDLDAIDNEIAHLQALISVAKTEAQNTETKLIEKIQMLEKTKGNLNHES